MDKEEENYSVGQSGCFQGMDYSLDPHENLLLPHHPNMGENTSIVDYIRTPSLPVPPPPQASTSLDKLSLADVMHFADFGPKLALNQPKFSDDYGGVDPAACMLKFPVLSNKFQQAEMMGPPHGATLTEEGEEEGEEEYEEEHTERRSMRLRIMGSGSGREGKSQRRKKPRSLKTSEEVESQRMTHIAVERNRRKQMNEHLRVLRSLMPGSYVQRGDQASIIGGAIEFVRELEQLLQCLESQKRRRLLGGAEGGPRQVDDSPSLAIQPSPQTPFFPSLPIPNDQTKFVDFDDGPPCEETAEIKSCLADIEVKLLGQDAMIKVLSRRRPGQLLKTIAALEDLQFNILHTNITTIEQTVLYSFIVKIAGESRFTAEDISNTVQQIFNFIHASSI